MISREADYDATVTINASNEDQARRVARQTWGASATNSPYSEGYAAWQSYLFSNVSCNPPDNPYTANTIEHAEWERGGDDASCDYDNFMYDT